MFTVKIETENAAFDTGDNTEVIRILKHVTKKLENGITYGSIMDVNGNKVGSWTF